MKKILGLDLGTNSIGWAVAQLDFDNKNGKIEGLGSRIIPMSQDILGKFDSGVSVSQTAERTDYRSVRRLYQRDNLRRDRLHRVLNIIGFLPEHYKDAIDFEKNFGQFKKIENGEKEKKLNYQKNAKGNYEFIFMDSFKEMIAEFEDAGQNTKIPLDWTLYYLRKKALTEKISKQELAWVILNFNQKRGYYQLRGDEDEVKVGKKKTFEVLKVDKVVDSGETIKKTGDKLFTVYFTNGWEYPKQVVKTENWIGKTKEFIVTTSTLKNGELKRTYKKVDSEKDWIAIKEKAQQDIDSFNEENNTVGVALFIYNSLLKNPKEKIRGKLIKTIERHYYKDELKKILKTQIKYHQELQDKQLYRACIDELYPRNEAHQNNIKDRDFENLFIDDIIFYQRPLKSKKSTISGCQYEKRPMKDKNGKLLKDEDGEQVTKPVQGISKSHPLFQEFRLWQFLKNLRIHKKEHEVDGKLKINYDVTNQLLNTEELWSDLFDFLNTRKEVDSKQLIQYLRKRGLIKKEEVDNYRWNYVLDKKYPCNETKAQFISRFKKIESFDLDEKYTQDFEAGLWHIIYSVKDKHDYEKALGTFAVKNDIDKESFVEAFKKFPPFKNDYGAYSEKAIKKLLPLMRRGKYWDEKMISGNVRSRIAQYMERVKGLKLPEKPSKKEIENAFEKYQVVDDDIPKQLVKSFIPFNEGNPLTALNTYQACYAIYERHSEVSEITQWKTPADIDQYLHNFKQHSLRNPVVEQVVTETLRTVRDIWTEYGDFDEIHVELGRNMKSSADKRKRMTERISENENTNQRIKGILTELMNDGIQDVKSYSPSQQEILKIYEEGVYNSSSNVPDTIEKIRKNSKPTKSDINKYKLWLKQGYVSPYTGKTIPLNELFSHKYEIEHIIPQSRFFNNSLSNKVICESEVNRKKGNKTAYEFIKDFGGSIINGSEVYNLENYEGHCSRYFKNNKQKLKILLTEEIPKSFVKRQLNDTRYISKVVKGLLSNIVRKKDEREVTAKNLVPVNGAITSKLKYDWGLNDIWNEIVAPRFKRLNEMTGTNDFGYMDYQTDSAGNKSGKQFFRLSVPQEIEKGFSAKRIDHRHHALDAVVIACTTKDHINYITSLETQRDNHSLIRKLRNVEIIQRKNNKTGKTYTQTVAKSYHKPWKTFTTDTRKRLEETIISFKQNKRVINKTNNKTRQWVKQNNGKYKKQLVKQTKGENWAVRKPLHKETVSGAVNIREYKTVALNVATLKRLNKPELNERYILRDKKLSKKIKHLRRDGYENAKILKYFKDKKYIFNDKNIKKVEIYFYIKATASREELSGITNRKRLEKITDSGIKQILENHLKNFIDENGKEKFDLAFSPAGIDELNKNIISLNNGKKHQPIYKVRIYESGSKFAVGENGINDKKYVEAAKGTNLFFAVYETKNKKGETKRTYETVPFNEVLEHQKQTAHLPLDEKPMIPVNKSQGAFLFALSPGDLVYVPTDEEIDNSDLVDFNNLNRVQVNRIYKMVSSSGNQCFFIKSEVSNVIINKKEFSALNKMEKSVDDIMVKSRCWKLKVNRLGKIIGVEK